MGSNCMNLLIMTPRCDLTNRDFSDSSIPYSYLHKRDLSGCKFGHYCLFFIHIITDIFSEMNKED